MFRGSESIKPAKEEVAYIHCQHFINYIFLPWKWILETKIIILHLTGYYSSEV
jgi:hypothetical protein